MAAELKREREQCPALQRRIAEAKARLEQQKRSKEEAAKERRTKAKKVKKAKKATEQKPAAQTLRGVTQKPTGQWQAQIHHVGKSRYLGCFQSKEAAALGYEVARELLKEGKEVNGIRVLGKKKLSAGQTDDLLTVCQSVSPSR